MTETLNVGDRVFYNGKLGGLRRFVGKTGTVRNIDNLWDANVDWDKGPLNSIHGREFLTRIEPLPEPKIEEVSPRAQVLREAEKLITGDRNQHYGEPMDNFKNIASFWNTFLRHKLKDDEKITPGDTAALMILVKVAREIAGGKEDNKVDLAGYAACWAEVDR